MRHATGIPLLPVLLFISACGDGEAERSPDLRRDRTGAGGVTHGDLPLRLVDALDRTVVLDSLPGRIVSLVPSATETLLRLGAVGRLVGRTDYDTAQSLAHLPSVGGGLHPNSEAIVALEPELVIRFVGDSDMATPRLLDRMGIRHLAIRPNGIQDIRDVIGQMGAIAGRRATADSLLARMDSVLGEIRNRIRDRPAVRVCYLLGGTPLWVAGPGSFIGELLEVAGGENVFSDLGVLYGPVNTEAFLVRAIDVLLAAEGAAVELPQAAIPLRRVSPAVEIPGPHLADAALELARTLHPEAFR